MKILLTCLVPAAAALALCGHSAAAAEKKPVSRIGVMLQVMSSGQCIDNAGSRKSGAALQGWKCNPRNLNQRFAIARQGTAKQSARIRNKLSSLCIDVQRRSKKTRARIVQDKCSRANSQIWKLSASGTKDWFLIRARHSGLCLTFARPGKRDSFFVQSKCDRRNRNQKFKLRS